ALLAVGFPSVYIFRPAYIYPVDPRKEPNFSYRLLRAIYPAFRVLFPNQMIRADDLARAMVDVAVRGTEKRQCLVFENRDIRAISGKRADPGQAGELIARGANVMRGYWNNPEETAATFREGFFHTGDIGHQDTAGYFYILDRLKDMIVTGGENVYSGEVEAVIYSHPAVREVAVFGVPDAQWGELVMACVVLKTGETLTADDLIAFSRRSLASYKIPRRIEFSERDLPKSSSGKVLKKTLRERFWMHQQRAVS